VIFTCARNISSWIFPSTVLFLSPSPTSQNNFNSFHSSTSTYRYKTLLPYMHSCPLSLCSPFSHWYPPLEKIYFFPPALCFFKVTHILIVQGGFVLVLHICIYRAFIKLTLSPLTCSFSVTMLPNIQQHTVQCTILYSYIDGLFQYFSFSNIFFTFPTSHSPLR
jgi:hypothetical protein